MPTDYHGECPLRRREFLKSFTTAAIIASPLGGLASSRHRHSDTELLDLVQKQTTRYFTDFAHPISGMARERSGGANHYDCEHTVTTGGTGFGIMAIIAATERGWVSHNQARDQVTRIVTFLEKAEKHHGVFPHFMDGRTGRTIPFSKLDDGGDLVETSFLLMGLFAAREYFHSQSDTSLRDRITAIWHDVEWDWHVRKEDNQLLWHWSPRAGFAMNLPVRGWNECLITHIMAAASPTHGVAKNIFDHGWEGHSEFRNGREFYGVPLPLGPNFGGPLFFSHYSFLGLDPRQLSRGDIHYFTQNRNHARINHLHCVNNPHGYKGYHAACWGLSASDNDTGYSAHCPTNDKGIITPTAALSSMPYTPTESMAALRYFYQNLGDNLWGPYGFRDSFSEHRNWFSSNYLAIDQGPIVVMIENARSGLLWDLCMTAPEIQTGLKKLNFEINNDTTKRQTFSYKLSI